MQELMVSDCEDVGGGFLPLVLGAIGLGVSIVNNSGALYDFFSGVYDGFNGIANK
jgi:hypothetical protein